MAENFLYYGDNLDILRRYTKDESVDLVYLDPPFNSNQDYNVLFASQEGTRSAAQIQSVRGHLAVGPGGSLRLPTGR
jgi:site-specific DNA-methyltransferase (adenine-specific)